MGSFDRRPGPCRGEAPPVSETTAQAAAAAALCSSSVSIPRRPGDAMFVSSTKQTPADGVIQNSVPAQPPCPNVSRASRPGAEWRRFHVKPQSCPRDANVWLELRDAGGERSEHRVVRDGCHEGSVVPQQRGADREQVGGASEESGARMPQRSEALVVDALVGCVDDVVRARVGVEREPRGIRSLGRRRDCALERHPARVLDERGDALERERRVARDGARLELAPRLEQQLSQARGVQRRLDDARRVAHEVAQLHDVVAVGAEARERPVERRLGREPALLDQVQRGESDDRLRDREQRVVVVDGCRAPPLGAERVECHHPVGRRDAEHRRGERAVLDVAASPVEGMVEAGHRGPLGVWVEPVETPALSCGARR
ncbi:hypothetical protein QFZ29_003878 [Agromyces albus]|nr:hypothetical protein [Agromyces albus]